MESEREVYVIIGDDYLEELDARMRSYGITRRALAEAIGKDPSHISRMFNRPMQPSLATVKLIEQAIAMMRAEKRRAKQVDAELR